MLGEPVGFMVDLCREVAKKLADAVTATEDDPHRLIRADEPSQFGSMKKASISEAKIGLECVDLTA